MLWRLFYEYVTNIDTRPTISQTNETTANNLFPPLTPNHIPKPEATTIMIFVIMYGSDNKFSRISGRNGTIETTTIQISPNKASIAGHPPNIKNAINIDMIFPTIYLLFIIN